VPSTVDGSDDCHIAARVRAVRIRGGRFMGTVVVRGAMEATERYRCAACGETFETRSDLERHVHDAGLVD